QVRLLHNDALNGDPSVRRCNSRTGGDTMIRFHQVQPRIVPQSSLFQSRSGATLVEVLMSLLIMSIGIVSVFTLFPLSIVSSIRATQLTHGRILRDNISELVHTAPDILDPTFLEK